MESKRSKNKKFKKRFKKLIIFKDLDSLYIREDLCRKFSIGDNNIVKEIRNNNCLKVSEEEILKIEESFTSRGKHFHPKYIPLINVEEKIELIIYVDNTNKKMYIPKELCKKYDIDTEEEIIIDKIVYCNVSQEIIEKLEEKTLNKGIVIKRTYKELKEDNNKNMFVYYYDQLSNKFYITRDKLEKARNNKIEIEGVPLVINDKNCYSITKEQLEELQVVTNSFGIENVIDIKKKPLKTIIVYKDKRLNKIFIPEEYANNTNTNKKIILNKTCYEVTYEDLETIYNTNIYIVDVYTKKEIIKVDTIVCNFNGQLYISKTVLKDLNIDYINNKKIMVKEDIYVEINELILNEIEVSNRYNIIFKSIVPLKK